MKLKDNPRLLTLLAALLGFSIIILLAIISAHNSSSTGQLNPKDGVQVDSKSRIEALAHSSQVDTLMTEHYTSGEIITSDLKDSGCKSLSVDMAYTQEQICFSLDKRGSHCYTIVGIRDEGRTLVALDPDTHKEVNFIRTMPDAGRPNDAVLILVDGGTTILFATSSIKDHGCGDMLPIDSLVIANYKKYDGTIEN